MAPKKVLALNANQNKTQFFYIILTQKLGFYCAQQQRLKIYVLYNIHIMYYIYLPNTVDNVCCFIF